MEPTSMATGALAIGGSTAILAALWSKIRGLTSRLWSVLFVTVEISGPLAGAVKAYCWKNFKRSPFGNRYYNSDTSWVRPLNRNSQVAFEGIGKDPIIFWNGYRPVFVGITPSSQGNESNQNVSGDGQNKSGTITFIRGTFKIDEFLVKCLDEYNEKFHQNSEKRTSKRFFIRRCVGVGNRKHDNNLGGTSLARSVQPSDPSSVSWAVETGQSRLLKWNIEDIGPDIPRNKKALDALAFPPEVDEIILEIKHWLASEEWYRDRQIPWTRGILIFGQAGCGKTSLTRAIAMDYDLPVFCYDLSSMSNKEFLDFWQEMQSYSPCIALFEDIDAVFHGRKNITGDNGGGLTFDCVLNALGGIENANGIFKVITTNDISKLDNALGVPRNDSDGTSSTRPGRCDRVLELKVMTEECRVRVAQRILSDCPEYIAQIVEAGSQDSGAQFQDRCAKTALSEHWERKMESARLEPEDIKNSPVEMQIRLNDIYTKPFPVSGLKQGEITYFRRK